MLSREVLRDLLLFASLVETAARVRHENPPSSKNEVKTFASPRSGRLCLADSVCV